MSSEERSLIAHASFRESSEKFDHLVFAVIVAICGYLVQSSPFGKIGFNVETMYLYGLLVFGCAGLCAFKRSEWTVQIHAVNHSMLDALEKGHRERADAFRKQLKSLQRRAQLYYRLRNVFFFSGFLCHVGAKVIQQYLI